MFIVRVHMCHACVCGMCGADGMCHVSAYMYVSGMCGLWCVRTVYVCMCLVSVACGVCVLCTCTCLSCMCI